MSFKIYSETWRILPKQLHLEDLTALIIMLFICTVCLCWVELLIYSCIIMAFDRIIKSQSISLSLCWNIFSHKRLNSSFKDLEHRFPFLNARWFCRLLLNSQLLVQVSKREYLLSLNYLPAPFRNMHFFHFWHHCRFSSSTLYRRAWSLCPWGKDCSNYIYL